MAVFRVEKNTNYTVMANYHLRDIALSLKAKGLLSLMLSLPENWDYTAKGLARICKDGTDSIGSAIRELEQAGYVQRKRIRNALGHLTEIEYTILEKPLPVESRPESKAEPERENPVLDSPVLEEPVLDYPEQAFPDQEEPVQEKPAQLNKQKSNKEKLNKDLSSKDSFLPSGPEQCEPVQMKDGRAEREKIRAQIEYDIMRQRYHREQLDELVEILLEVQMNLSPTIRIGKDNEYPTTYVQERMSQITAMHIERVMDGIQDNRTQVRNTKAYLLATLFNSVSTLDNYYTMQANSEFGSSF